MAAYLVKSDVLVNSFVRKAPQSIVTKIGDYLAAGRPMINTCSSPEFRNKVENDGFGVNVWAEDVDSLKNAILKLYLENEKRENMGRKARLIAEDQFDRKTSYQVIVNVIEKLIPQG
jgi:glycosyltransferase involved in cell wall biosynthesis